MREVRVNDGTHYPLSLVARQEGTELAPRVDYRPDVITSAEAAKIASRLRYYLMHSNEFSVD